MDTFTWSIEDIKGISLSICMHKTLMGEEYTPSIEHQRRLNPAMKEVVNKEVLKWLHAEFIYAILDSSWVRLVQVVVRLSAYVINLFAI